MIYLATPYSDPNAGVRIDRAWEARRYMAALMKAGHVVFCPIAMTHDTAEEYGLPYEFEFWDRMNREFISVSSEVIIAQIPGWRKSRGVTHELTIAADIKKPVRYARFVSDILRLTMEPQS